VKTVVEGGIVDIAVEVRGAEEAANRCLLEDYILAGWACKHSHFVEGEGEEWNGDVAAVSDSSWFCGLYFATTVVIPCMAEVSSDDAGTCHFALEVTPTLLAAEGVGRNWRVAYVVVSYVAAALTLLVHQLPRLHLHPRHLLRLSLESPQVLCAHAGCHTAPVSPVAKSGWDHVRRNILSRSLQCLLTRIRRASCCGQI
jgi:hypothetical protein